MSLVVALADAGRTADALDEADRARPLLQGRRPEPPARPARPGAAADRPLRGGPRRATARRCPDCAATATPCGRPGCSATVARCAPTSATTAARSSDLQRCAAVAEANGLWNQLARAWQNLGLRDEPGRRRAGCAGAARRRSRGGSATRLRRQLAGAGPGRGAARRGPRGRGGRLARRRAARAGGARPRLRRRRGAAAASPARRSAPAGPRTPARQPSGPPLSSPSSADRPGSRLARQVAVLARWDAGERGADTDPRGTPHRRRLRRGGLDAWPSLSARFVAAPVRAGVVVADHGAARCSPTSRSPAARAARRRGRPGGTRRRCSGWPTHDRRGAERALRRALAVRADNAAALGATDLRAHAAVFGEELASAGLRLAVEDRRPAGGARVGGALARQRAAEPAGATAQRRRAGHRARSPARRHGSTARGAPRRAARHRAAPAAAAAGVGRPGAGPARPRLVGIAARRRRLRRRSRWRAARRPGPGRARPQRQRPARGHRRRRPRRHARPVPSTTRPPPRPRRCGSR